MDKNRSGAERKINRANREGAIHSNNPGHLGSLEYLLIQWLSYYQLIHPGKQPELSNLARLQYMISTNKQKLPEHNRMNATSQRGAHVFFFSHTLLRVSFTVGISPGGWPVHFYTVDNSAVCRPGFTQGHLIKSSWEIQNPDFTRPVQRYIIVIF